MSNVSRKFGFEIILELKGRDYLKRRAEPTRSQEAPDKTDHCRPAPRQWPATFPPAHFLAAGGVARVSRPLRNLSQSARWIHRACERMSAVFARHERTRRAARNSNRANHANAAPADI